MLPHNRCEVFDGRAYTALQVGKESWRCLELRGSLSMAILVIAKGFC